VKIGPASRRLGFIPEDKISVIIHFTQTVWYSTVMRKYRVPAAKIIGFLVFVAFMVYRHDLVRWGGLSDPVIDLIISVGIGVLTAFLALLAGHVATDKPLYRWMFWGGGIMLAAFFVTSGVRTYRATLVAKTPEQIVMTAVGEANNHTDKEIDVANKHTDTEVSMVQEDLKKATEHSDQQIASVKDGVKDLADQFNKGKSDLKESISKVGKPEPPELAKLQFSFGVPVLDMFPLRFQTVKANQDGTVTIEFTGRNVSRVSARSVDMWVQICSGCSYAKEPRNFQKLDGDDPRVRYRRLGDLNPGVLIVKTSLELIVPAGFAGFDTSFGYSCENCGADTAGWSETIRTMVTR